MKYYHADAQNQPIGLFTLDEIKAKVTAGELAANPMVLPEGGTEWKPLSAYEHAEPAAAGTGAAGPPPPPPASGAKSAEFAERLKSVKSTLMGDAVAGVLSLANRILNPKLIGRSLDFARDFGHYIVLAGALLALVYSIYAAIRFNDINLLLVGLGSVAALAIAQFAAQRFLGAGEKLIQGSSSRISTPAFLDCFALLAILAGVGFLLSGLFGAIQASDATLAIIGILLAVFWAFVAAIMLHPNLINLEIGEGSAGEEAIGLFTMAMKTGLKLVPLFFFLLAAAGCLLIIFGFFNAGHALAAMVPFVPMGAPVGIAGAGLLIIACFVPLIGYLYFIVFYLIFDIIRAILSIPGKLDALRR